jgi:hypothetical protein
MKLFFKQISLYVFMYYVPMFLTIKKRFMSQVIFDRLFDDSEMKILNHATRPNLSCYDDFHASFWRQIVLLR